MAGCGGVDGVFHGLLAFGLPHQLLAAFAGFGQFAVAVVVESPFLGLRACPWGVT